MKYLSENKCVPLQETSYNFSDMKEMQEINGLYNEV